VTQSIAQANDEVAESIGALRTFNEKAVENIHMYPNPAKTILTIEIEEGDYEQIVVFSMTGQVMKTERPSSDILRIDVSDYTPGMYFVRFISDGKATTKRFVRE